MAPGALAQVLGDLPNVHNDNLLVGFDTSDDASVFRVGENLGLVQSIDFFPPMVDDPFLFGQIAAANSLSDIYAMGGDPLMAIAILGWPINTLAPEVAQQVIDAAEHLVKGTPAIAGKKARASGPAAELPGSPVKVFDRDEAALGETLIEHYQRGESVMMLYRKGSDRALMAEHLQGVLHADAALPAEQRRLRQLTYHSAKGLQADAVFMLGDCQYLTSSPYKNQVYRQAGLGRSGDPEAYDNAQKDEVLRLAYVAVTRARQRLVAAGLGITLVPASVQTQHRADIVYAPLTETAAVAPIILSRRAGDNSPLLKHCLALIEQMQAVDNNA